MDGVGPKPIEKVIWKQGQAIFQGYILPFGMSIIPWYPPSTMNKKGLSYSLQGFTFALEVGKIPGRRTE